LQNQIKKKEIDDKIKKLSIDIELNIKEVISKNLNKKIDVSDFLLAYLLAGADIFYTINPLKDKKNQTLLNFILLINIIAKSIEVNKKED